ncbi:MAG: taurine catabolism dioxygenase TauD [endosymbiont of Galathealinum brachiosum]|uniref:Taurine catabolism dioxygenase TauD n=1 Tax=endosymbiont of Galathealinum brachiosum TaxID=2200906 RepID=A0A370D821_9GAMM|nr:MAG: taurine catabolism dioxygenase TauD [endosymbiont of Galathealinum brachiosum]
MTLIFDPLNLSDESAYQKWRELKLRAYSCGGHESIVDIEGDKPDPAELHKIQSACSQFNYSIYRLNNAESGTKHFVHETGSLLGLQHLDGNLCSDEDNITSIQVVDKGRHAVYIPYTDRKLTWHTDGYYNKESKTIRAMILHCVRPAQSGGENLMLDHEMAYIQLRDENPRFIEAFLQSDALTIPPNIESGKEIRGAQSGPVFTMDSQSSSLHMRFSARTRNIEWKDNSITGEAVDCMKGLLNSNNPYVITYRMQAGEGIIANNVLHNRTAFIDSEAVDEKRLLYRARYYDRVNEVASRQS